MLKVILKFSFTPLHRAAPILFRGAPAALLAPPRHQVLPLGAAFYGGTRAGTLTSLAAASIDTDRRTLPRPPCHCI